jgi:hypothetical protein
MEGDSLPENIRRCYAQRENYGSDLGAPTVIVSGREMHIRIWHT